MGYTQAVMLMILGLVLLVVAIAGGTFLHPALFLLGVVALLAFFQG